MDTNTDTTYDLYFAWTKPPPLLTHPRLTTTKS